MKIIITGACAVSSRSVLRSLKMSSKFKDAEFVGWDMCSLLYGVYAHEFDRLYKVPSVSDPEYHSVISDILSKEKPDAVIVVPEVEVLYWTEHNFDVPHIVPPVKFSNIAISKEALFTALKDTSLIPKSYVVSADELLSDDFTCELGYPVWIRDGSAGTASGKGSFKATCHEDLKAWAMINRNQSKFQLSEFLPGANYGCFCLFKNGKLIKMAQAERIEYIMAKVAISGITGNTSKGKLINNDKIKKVALEAIDILCKQTGETMSGLVVVDMKAKEDGTPIITEINIRHVAFSSSFAAAGFNLSEYQLLLALDRDDEVSAEVEHEFPKDNLILRDVDGNPIYVAQQKTLKVGDFI